jgi:hypothetical protein
MEGRIGGRIDLVAAIFASVATARCNAVKMGVLSTLSAIMAITKAGAHKMLQAAIFRWETVLKLAECRGFRFVFHTPLCSTYPYMSQGDNYQTSSG